MKIRRVIEEQLEKEINKYEIEHGMLLFIRPPHCKLHRTRIPKDHPRAEELETCFSELAIRKKGDILFFLLEGGDMDILLTGAHMLGVEVMIFTPGPDYCNDEQLQDALDIAIADNFYEFASVILAEAEARGIKLST